MPTALVSVSNTDGLAEFVRKLVQKGWEIIATPGTAEALGRAGISDISHIADLTGKSRSSRTKTLSFEVHDRLMLTDEELESRRILPIDLVCVNFYSLLAAMSRPGATIRDANEKVDVGGPALVVSANKGGRWVIVDTYGYERFSDFLSGQSMDETELKLELAVRGEEAVNLNADDRLRLRRAALARYRDGIKD